jgi:hypothetical protein
MSAFVDVGGGIHEQIRLFEPEIRREAPVFTRIPAVLEPMSR